MLKKRKTLLKVENKKSLPEVAKSERGSAEDDVAISGIFCSSIPLTQLRGVANFFDTETYTKVPLLFWKSCSKKFLVNITVSLSTVSSYSITTAKQIVLPLLTAV